MPKTEAVFSSSITGGSKQAPRSAAPFVRHLLLITAEVPAQGLHNGKAQGALRKLLRQYMSDFGEEQGYAQVA